MNGLKKDSIEIDGIRLSLCSVNTLVIGSGAAALNAAVCLAERGIEDIAIVTDRWGGGTSFNAGSDKQTYYKLSLAGDVADSPYALARDLYNGGCMHGDIALCEAAHSAQAFYRLVQIGVPFPQDRYGNFIGFKTDHDPRGRGTSAGPLTSKFMCEALAREIGRWGIPVLDGHEVIALLVKDFDGRRHCIGALALDRAGLDERHFGLVLFNAVNVVLGTGGPAGMYETSVYPESQTGSTGLALKIGAIAHNLTETQFGIASIRPRWNLSGSYQQAIPRYVSTAGDGSDEREFLNDFFPDMRILAIALFLKGYQWPFDARKVANHGSSLVDLLVHRETTTFGRRVFLDYTRNPFGVERIDIFDLNRIGTEAFNYLNQANALADTPLERLVRLNQPAVDLFRQRGIYLGHDRLEIAVCAQHNNGGLKGNIWWESNIRHLFPVGEVNGSHGVYRPGGASLNAGQVGGLRAAMFIKHNYNNLPPRGDDFLKEAQAQMGNILTFIRRVLEAETDPTDLSQAIGAIKTRMTGHAGIIRDSASIGQSAQEAWKQLTRLRRELSINLAQDLPLAFKTLDLCLTQAVYLEAIREYLEKGGASRGSFLVCDSAGELPCEGVENWRFGINSTDKFVSRKILEVRLDDGGQVEKRWVDIRPIPELRGSFEQMWKEYREGTIFRREDE